jgi:excisionase family DNA binding protein
MAYIGIKRVSEILAVKEKTIYQWAETGLIPCHKLNGLLRFKEDEIMAWADGCKRPARTGIMGALRPAAPERKVN